MDFARMFWFSKIKGQIVNQDGTFLLCNESPSNAYQLFVDITNSIICMLLRTFVISISKRKANDLC